jgi:putative ABC transport system permease protein
MTLWKLVAREIQRHPGRASLTVLSIVVGVAAVASVLLATGTARQAYREMYEALTGRASLEVVGAGGAGFDERVQLDVARVPEVQAAIPLVLRPTVLYRPGGRLKLLAVGIDPARDRLVHDYKLAAGELSETQGGVVLETGFARSLGVVVGDEVKLLTRRGVKMIKISGLLAPQGTALFNQGGVLFLPLGLAQRLFAQSGQIDSLQIVLQPSADEASARQEIARVLPAGLSVRSPAARTELARETMLASEVGLILASALTVVVAVIIILNTFFMNVHERRRHLATLRAVGATQRQLRRLMLGEGLAMGTVGSLLGLALGLGGAWLLTRAMELVFDSTLPPLSVRPLPLLVAAVLGVGLSLAASYFPAREAGRVSPMEAMREGSADQRAPRALWPTLLSSGLMLTAAVLFLGSAAGMLPVLVRGLAGCIVLLGFVFLLPLFVGPLSRVVAAIAQPLLGVQGRMAERQLLRRRTRTALTVGVLFVAVSAGVGMGNSILNNIRAIHNWFQRTVVGDFFIRAVLQDPATAMAAEIPLSIGREIQAIPGVSIVESVRWVSARAEGMPIVVIARDFPGDRYLALDLKEGTPADVRRGLFAGEVVLGSHLAERTGRHAGDFITLETTSGPQRLRVVGVANEYNVGGLAVVMERSTSERLLGVQGADAFSVSAPASELDHVAAALDKLCREHGLLLHSAADLTRLIDRMMVGVIGALWIILALGVVVSAFGIVNTLSMNVLEQTREIGVLRAIGMTRTQVRRAILCQATILGLIGVGTGALAGVGVGYLIDQCTLPLMGHQIDFVLSPALLAGGGSLAFAIVLLAAWVPAERAARLDLTTALQYE